MHFRQVIECDSWQLVGACRPMRAWSTDLPGVSIQINIDCETAVTAYNNHSLTRYSYFDNPPRQFVPDFANLLHKASLQSEDHVMQIYYTCFFFF